MSTQAIHAPNYRRELGNGLRLRWSAAADAEGLAELYAEAFRHQADSPPDTGMLRLVGDYMSGQHPLLGPGDFALVEDAERGKIVAAACLMRHEWEYGGIPFGVGRPEIVASDPEYRERGLVRAVFELIHARSAALDHLAQGITGIPFYYRQFGYEYALDLGGERSVYFAAIPGLKPDQTEPFALREATLDDLPRLRALYDLDRARSLVSACYSDAYWRWMISDRHAGAAEGWRPQMIASREGSSVLGYLLTPRRRWDDALGVVAMRAEPGVGLASLLPSVLRALQAQAQTLPTFRPESPAPARIQFALGRAHPVYDALGLELAATYDPPYAWYVRVPDLPRFITTIAPALERRLAESVVAGYTGELRMDFYRSGLRLAFADGRLAAAEHWSARAERFGPKANAGFPPLVFLQLLFGHRSLAQLRESFPDVRVEQEVRPTLEALFPMRPAWVLPQD
jgi:hypothetical protein